MSECDKSALELAESSEWGALQRLVSAHPVRAEELDDFGMMPLHWACTDSNVPLRAAKVLLDAYPPAAMLKNKGGLVPLHIAVKANTKPEVLRALVAAHDDALCVETPAGETPADLARACGLAHDKVTLLTLAEQQLRASGRAPPRTSDRYKSLHLPVGPLVDSENVPPRNGSRDSSRRGSNTSVASDSGWVLTGTNSNSLSLGSLHSISINSMNSVGTLRSASPPSAAAAVPLPPRWRLDSRCHICQVKFSYLKHRHHCRSCGESVCGTHATARVALPHIGLLAPQRVCLLCYDEMMREDGKPVAAVVNMYGARKDPRGHSSSTVKTPTSRVLAPHNNSASASAPLPRSSPLLRPTRSGLALTASLHAKHSHSVAGRFDMDLITASAVDYDSSDSSDDTDNDRSTRPRAWTQVDVNDHVVPSQQLESHARELHAHLHTLQQHKRTLVTQLTGSARDRASAQHEKLVNEQTVAAMRADRMLDIRLLPSDDDALDNEDDGIDSVNNDPAVDPARTHNNLGLALYEAGEFARATCELRRSVSLNALDPDVWYNLARAQLAVGELSDAERSVRRALELVGRSYALLALLGKILHAQGADDESIDVFREALGLMDHHGNGVSDSDDDDDVGSATVGW